jgi:hypothetical protein
MKELEIEGYKYSVNYHEGEGRQIVIDQILIKYSENWYRVDLNSEAGRKVKAAIESQHVY